MKKFIANILFISIVTVTFLYGIISVAVETTDIQTETVGATMEISAQFRRGTAAHDQIPIVSSFPLNTPVFNSSVDFFCAQHGVAFGSKYQKHTIGAGYHNEITVTKDAVTTSKQPTADIDTSAYYYVDANLNLVSSPQARRDFSGYHDRGETPTDTAYTNWVYRKEPLSFGCPDGCTYRGSANENEVKLAFLMAAYKAGGADTTRANGMDGINNTYARGSYSSDPLQYAVWSSSWLNSGAPEGNKLAIQAAKYWSYHEDSANPNVDVTKGADVGAVLSGNTYVVGPFNMSRYVTASSYKTGKVNTTEGQAPELGDDYTDVSQGNPNDAYNYGTESLQDIFGSASNLQGTVIGAKAVLTNGNGNLKEIAIPVPKAGDSFSINLSASDVAGFDELKELKFEYQRVHVYGNGNRWNGAKKILTFKQYGASRGGNAVNGGCNSYNCQTCSHTGLSWSERSDVTTHDYWCGGSGYCSNGNSQSSISYNATRTEGCTYTWSCGKTAHTHGTGCNTDSCNHTHNSNCCSLEEHTHTKSCKKKSDGTYSCGKTAHTHGTGCNTNSCSHTCGSSCCSLEEHSHGSGCSQVHSCTKDYCSHGHQSGHHSGTCKTWGTSHIHSCSGTTRCSHGHTSCYKFDWGLAPRRQHYRCMSRWS